MGQHCLPTPERRWKEHWDDMNKYDYLLYRAFKKYGKEAFTIETLCVVPVESLGQMEAYWAEQLETYSWDTPGGYNMIWCGALSRLGIKHTLEALEKIGEASSKRFEDIEVRHRLSDTMKKVLQDPVILHRMSEGQTRRYVNNPEEREKQSQIMKKILESPEARDKMSKALKKALETPEAREKMRQAQLKRYDEHPEQRERMREATTQRYEDLEERKKQSNKVKELWAKPDFRRKMLEARKASWARRKAMKNSGVTTETTV